MIATITGHSPRAIAEMLRVYGRADSAMTGSALAWAMDAEREAA